MRTIDLKDFERTGEGAVGCSYRNKLNKDLLLKMYEPRFPIAEVESELLVSRKVYDLGIPTPEPGEIVTDGNTHGLLFKFIDGKRSFSRMIADEPERLEEYSRYFARTCKQIHSYEIPDGLFPDIKPQYISFLENDIFFSPKEKQVISDFISTIPDTKYAIHGDLHIGNIITTLPKGKPLTEPHKFYYIDLGLFARGFNLIDIGMLYNMCVVAEEHYIVDLLHITKEQAFDVWRFFVDEYFDSKPLDEVNAMILPYSGLKYLMIEYLRGNLPPYYINHVKKCFDML